jgi:hypothetical protein
MAGEFEQITSALKTVYADKVVEPMVNEDAPFRKQLSKSVPAGARLTEGIVKFGGNLNPPENIGQLVDGGTLPTAKERTDVQFQLTPTLFAGAMQIGWITRAAANSSKSAFNKGEVRRRTDEVIADTAKFIESTYVGTHGTGRRARVETDGTSNFVASKPEGVRLLRENMYITVRTTDGGATIRWESGTETVLHRISALTQSTRTVTYTGSDETLTAGDHVHPTVEINQLFTTNPFANGLRGLVDDATYLATLHGLSRATYPKLNSNVFSSGGTLRNLTEQLLVRACHEIRARSGKRVTDIWTSEGQVEKYIEFVAPDRRYNVGGNGVQGMGTGYKEENLVHYAPGISANVRVSFDLVPREMYLLNWSTFFHYVSKELGFVDEGEMLKLTPASGTYKASFLGYVASIENIGCDFPLANGVIRDLADPAIGD